MCECERACVLACVRACVRADVRACVCECMCVRLWVGRKGKKDFFKDCGRLVTASSSTWLP